MLFNSYVFLLAFLPATLAGWWLLPTRTTRLGFLTLASYLFYGWWDYRFVPLMVLSTSADFFAGWAIARTSVQRHRTVWLVSLLVFNLGILGVFKYYDFFAESLNGLGRAVNVGVGLPLLHLVLPIGISFYTFNSIGYTIDIYRGRLKPPRHFLDFFSFVAMFPHLIAGPILRFADMADQFNNLREEPDSGEWVTGLWLLGVGLAKKVLVADVLAEMFVDPLWQHAMQLDGVEAWFATLGYTLQIYFDFSGYSDMAVGLALLLGFRFPPNFNSPYQATNIVDFWRRWHMSLSFWLRDYLFIPLGGSRGSRWQTFRNLMITMFLGGLWHGAAWTFVIWGLFHGALLGGHALLRQRWWVPRSAGFARLATFLAVMMGWVFFRAHSLTEAGGMFGALSGLRPGEGGFDYLITPPALLLTAAALAAVWVLPNSWAIHYPRSRLAAAGLALLLLVCLVRLAAPSPFLYFQF